MPSAFLSPRTAGRPTKRRPPPPARRPAQRSPTFPPGSEAVFRRTAHLHHPAPEPGRSLGAHRCSATCTAAYHTAASKGRAAPGPTSSSSPISEALAARSPTNLEPKPGAVGDYIDRGRVSPYNGVPPLPTGDASSYLRPPPEARVSLLRGKPPITLTSSSRGPGSTAGSRPAKAINLAGWPLRFPPRRGVSPSLT